MKTLELFGLFIGWITLIFGIIQYIKAQKWKRIEFVAKEIKEFESISEIIAVQKFLDYNNRPFKILINGEEKEFFATDNLIQSSLKPYASFDKSELYIRDCFDQFFNYLERIEYYIKAGVASKKEFKPYIIYWITLIGNKERKSSDCFNAIWSFIDTYHREIQSLFNRYGFDIKPSI